MAVYCGVGGGARSSRPYTEGQIQHRHAPVGNLKKWRPEKQRAEWWLLGCRGRTGEILEENMTFQLGRRMRHGVPNEYFVHFKGRFSKKGRVLREMADVWQRRVWETHAEL